MMLSVGMRPNDEPTELTDALGITYDEHGFAKGAETQGNIRVIGAVAAPMDIEETITRALDSAVDASKGREVTE